MHLFTPSGLLLLASRFAPRVSMNLSFVNPVIPGWHSDPSCVFVAERDNTFFCATSTFLITPGIPIHASKDLVNWKLASHALNRPSQVPYMNESINQNDGIFAPTLRYHDGVFYLIVVYVFMQPLSGVRGLVFTTTNPYDNSAWSEPVRYNTDNVDPDLFWEGGKVYVTQSDITQMTIDLETGNTTTPYRVWNGTGGTYPEGPHIYKKDDYYYLLIGEGGTETNHSVTMARSNKISGPYESYAGNPVLTNRGTQEYFQTVGHADLFQDAHGKWWGCALSTRSGPEWTNYPMGRETVLFPVTWETGKWPVMQPIRGHMSGWELPPRNMNLPGKGPFVGAPDVVDFTPGSAIPSHFSFWRWPKKESFTISPPGHPNTLRLLPSKTISAPLNSIAGSDGITLMLRLQTDTLFTFNLDVSFRPKKAKEEVGVTVFLTQQQHLDLGIVLAPASNSRSVLIPHFNMSITGQGRYEGILPGPVLKPVPKAWLHKPISLQIQAKNDTHYTFSAASSSNRGARLVIGHASAKVVSGITGLFTGSLVGVYATSNGGEGTTESYISRWRYTGNGQKIDFDEYVPSRR